MESGDTNPPERVPTEEPAPAAAAPPPPAPGRLAGIKSWVWPLVCCFQLGLLVCVSILYLKSPAPVEHVQEEPVEVEPPPVPLPEVEKPPPPVISIGDIRRGDTRIREHRYDQALNIYQPLVEASTDPARAPLHYRMALAFEGLGRWDQALASYRAVVASPGVPPVLSWSAQLGQARVWLATQHLAEAKSLLFPLFLQSAQSDPSLQQLAGEVRYTLALAEAREVLGQEKPSPLGDAVIAAAADWTLEHALDWIAVEPKLRRPRPAPAANLEIIGNNPEEAYVNAVMPLTETTTLVDQAAGMMMLKTQWSAKARERAEGRTATLALDKLSFLEVVSGLLEPAGLIGKLHKGVLDVVEEHETSPGELAGYRTETALRALRGAVLAFPRHPLMPAAYLALGNLEAVAKHYPEAISWYERLHREAPRSPLRLQADYNLGLTRRHVGNSLAARNAFYRAIDRAPGHELAPLAYLWIGRLLLEEGEPTRALSALRRAVNQANGSDARPVAALTLAAAYLWANEPVPASALLLKHREAFLHDPYYRSASFLDTLARFRLVTDRRQAQREAGELLAAILALGTDGLLGPVGKLLIGQAYRDLGMPDQMAETYIQALGSLKGSIAAEMSYELADYWYASNSRGKARSLLAALANTQGGKWGPQSRLRLAEIALQEGRPKECVKRARKLLEEPQAVERIDLLRLLGKAYEQLGDHRQAARCFAGQLPE